MAVRIARVAARTDESFDPALHLAERGFDLAKPITVSFQPGATPNGEILYSQQSDDGHAEIAGDRAERDEGPLLKFRRRGEDAATGEAGEATEPPEGPTNYDITIDAIELAIMASDSGTSPQQVMDAADIYERRLREAARTPGEDRVFRSFRAWCERLSGDHRAFLHGLFDLAEHVTAAGDQILSARVFTRKSAFDLSPQGEVLRKRPA
jgi:hypothetical protein